MLVDHIRQLRSNYRGSSNTSTVSSRQIQDRPPAYEDVVKNQNQTSTNLNSSNLNDDIDGISENVPQTALEDFTEPPSYVEATNLEATNLEAAHLEATNQSIDRNEQRITTVVTVEQTSSN